MTAKITGSTTWHAEKKVREFEARVERTLALDAQDAAVAEDGETRPSLHEFTDIMDYRE